jgi:RNA polymerase sigma factor (TIGR02999 family)
VHRDSAAEITDCLRHLREGRSDLADTLIPVIYRELKKVAVSCMRGERPGGTLQPTALVNEAFVRLLGPHQMEWQNRAHFFGMAAGLMRRIIIDAARRRHALRRGSGFQFVQLTDTPVASKDASVEEVLAVDECLARLAAIDERQARLVELRFFGGLTIEEMAEVAGISEPTVKRELQSAKAWLRREMTRMAGGKSHGASAMAAS